MRNIFIINTKAGKGKFCEELEKKIQSDGKELRIPPEIYYTKCVGDAEVFVKEQCQISCDDQIRFFACGGDGTLNEVLNGAINCEKASIGVVPIGTGNDFCRNFPKAGDFMSPKAQLLGDIVKCDAIKYTGNINNKSQTRYCANMFNIGFDCNVVDMTARLKTYPLISGSMAYLLSVLIILIKKKGADLKIYTDDELCHDGPLLLTSISNGCYCGGGIKSNPRASIHDGQIDINIIKNLSRTKFLTMFPSYQKGTHLEINNVEKFLTSKKCKKITIIPNNGTMRLCTDGEIAQTGEISFEIIHNAFNMSIPAVL